MISAIRVEAVASDPAQAKAEIDTILSHMRTIGHYEGIVPREGHVKAEVYPARDHEDEIIGEEGGRHIFPFEGRKVVEFRPEHHSDYRPQMPVEQNQFEVKHLATGDTWKNERLVVDRLLPMDWPQTFQPRPSVDEAESIFYELSRMGMTYTIKRLPLDTSSGFVTITTTGIEPTFSGTTTSTAASDQWRIDVEYSGGKCGYHTVGPTILAAARDAYNQAKDIFVGVNDTVKDTASG